MAHLDSYDEVIARYLIDTGPDAAVDKQRLKETASDPKRLARVFSFCVENLSDQKRAISPKRLSEKFGHMVGAIDGFSTHGHRDDILKSAADAVSRMDGDVLSIVLAGNLKHTMDNGLFDLIVRSAGNEQLIGLAVKFKLLQQKAGTRSQIAAPVHPETIGRAFKKMMASEKARQLQKGIQERYRLEIARKKSLTLRLKTGIGGLIKKEKNCFMDDQVMLSLPDTVERLYAVDKTRTADQIVARLCDGLSDDDSKIRLTAANVLSITNDIFAPPEGTEKMLALSYRLIAWIESENTVTPAFQNICRQLTDLCQTLIAEERPLDVGPIREAFYRLAAKSSGKNTDIRKIAAGILARLGAPDSAAGTSQPSTEKTAAPKTTAANKPVPEKKAPDVLTGHFATVDGYLQKQDTEGAVIYLFDLIVRYAREKKFAWADALRDKMLDVDPMALSEIIKTGEIIEEEKSGAIDDDFLNRWTDLTDQLTAEEVNALYYAFQEASYDADHTLFQQGQFNSSLFFINRGHLKLVCRQGNREILLKSLTDGHIAGEDTFFESSVCTTSLITLSMVKLGILDREAMAQWKERVPGLESKLGDYCHRLESAPDLLKKRGMDRRTYHRAEISGPVSIQILSGKGEPVGNPFRGSLSDISAGGISFYIKTSKAETARLLLGRRLSVKFSLPAINMRKPLEKEGMVIGVKYHLNNDYSVHLKFDELIDERLVKGLAG